MKVSIFDRFAAKKANEPKRKLSSPTPYRARFSELEESGAEAKADCPEESNTIEDFVWALKEACRDRYKKALDGDWEPMKAEVRFFLSRDRMCAYACLLPPEHGGDGVTFEEFLGDLHYEGITYGVLEENLQRRFDYGYLHIFPVARGKAPQAGEDGKVIELFQRRKNMRLEVQDGSQVDFSEEAQLQPIRKGAPICLIRPPKAGVDGTDVTGQAIPCPKVVAAQVPQGVNTAIGRGGLALLASVDGILYIENDCFCIHEQKIMDGDLDHFQGTLQISGNLYIGGNVDGGVKIEASGDIVINGKMGQAQVTSTAGTIRVQQGVYGTQGQTVLNAAYQVQSPTLEQAEVHAGTSVIAEMISNSTIECSGTVFAMTGRGMITGSRIRAGESVLCLRVGNLAGDYSHFSVGYPPHIPGLWEQSKNELVEVQATIDKIWDPITTLRKKGTRITDGEQSVLDKLLEQRELYTKRRESLTETLKSTEKVLDKKSKGRVRCEKVHPPLDVQIGRLLEKIITVEDGCNVHVEDNRIYMK